MRIPPHYLDAVGVLEIGEMGDEGMTFRPVATGTLLGYASPDQTDVSEDRTRRVVFLVTNKHVIDDQDELYIRFNQGSGSKRFRIAVKREDGSELFQTSDRFDVAVTGIQQQALREAGAEFASIPEEALLDLEGLESKGIVGGDTVFTLGFPMGLAGDEKKYAIVRGGVLARMDREIVNTTGSFLIDCPVFPGNSGGPVVLPTEIHTLGQEEPRTRVHVIGIVSGYLPWEDMAISQQTRRPRITFEENSGLATVVPLDAVNELVTSMFEEAKPDGGQPETTENEAVIPAGEDRENTVSPAD
jgi:hypothetical protein